MADNKAITYKQVKSATGKFGGNADDVWERIGKITGSGAPGRNADGDASIDLTEVSESKRSQIDALLERAEERDEEAKAEAKTETKQRGNK